MRYGVGNVHQTLVLLIQGRFAETGLSADKVDGIHQVFALAAEVVVNNRALRLILFAYIVEYGVNLAALKLHLLNQRTEIVIDFSALIANLFNRTVNPRSITFHFSGQRREVAAEKPDELPGYEPYFRQWQPRHRPNRFGNR